MFMDELLKYYSRKEVQKSILSISKNREIAIKFADKGYGKRPDVIEFENDVYELAKKGATSFHISEELWNNPLLIKTGMSKKELDNLRIGWDLILDVDGLDLEYSKLAAYYLIEALKFYDIKNVSIKFSGNKGFHIGVPFEAFPERIGNQETKNLFPDAARRIAFYIKELIKKPLGEKIMHYEKNNFSKIVEKTKENPNKITYYEKNKLGDSVAKLNAEPFLNIDTILISSRHLFRMPYSLHEKSGLASVPLNPEKVLDFKKENADPKNAKVSEFRFLDREKVAKGDARKLLMQAFDFSAKREEEMNAETKRDYEIKDAMPENFFPPCIKLISNGLSDGRKRALFILINFLSSLGWGYDDIEKYLKEWNKKNAEPLRENYLVGQLRYHKSQKKKILPPNCNNMMYYVNIGVCRPDNLCSKIKNPVSYSIRKSFFALKEGKNKGKPL